jgi:hypothetical protein
MIYKAVKRPSPWNQEVLDCFKATKNGDINLCRITPEDVMPAGQLVKRMPMHHISK